MVKWLRSKTLRLLALYLFREETATNPSKRTVLDEVGFKLWDSILRSYEKE